MPSTRCAGNALRTKDRAKLIELVDALNQQSPDSKYLPQLYGPYAAALGQTGGTAKAFQFAERVIGRDPANEDLLLILADGYMTRKQWDRAATYGLKLASVMSSHPDPNGVPAADWERKRAVLAGRGYYIAGMSYASAAKYPQADTNLRAALPYVKGDRTLLGGVLFYLASQITMLRAQRWTSG